MPKAGGSILIKPAFEFSRLTRFFPPLTCLFLTSLTLAVVYICTLSEFLPPGDSGELIVTALKLKVAHPPGYPIYTGIAHLFTLLPISTVAWRVGLFSLVAQLLALGFVFCLVHDWLKRRDLAIAVTFLFGIAPLTWRYATEAEVFALNNMFAAILLWIFYRYHATRALKWIYLACLVMGVAACHHLTILLMCLPFVLMLLWQNARQLFRPRVLALGLLLFVVGLLPYLSLFRLGREPTMISWGDFSNWDGFWTHVLRREYGTFQLANGDKQNANFLSKIYYFAREMDVQTFHLSLPIFIWSAWQMWRIQSEAVFARMLFVSLIFYAVVFHSLSNLDLNVPLYLFAQSRMWLLPLLLIFLIVAWGLSELLRKSRFSGRILLTALLVVAVLDSLHTPVKAHDDFFERVGHSMLDGVQVNAVILMREDVYVNAIRYLQTVQQVRSDVHMVPVDSLSWPWLSARVQQEIPGFQMPAGVLRDHPQTGEYGLRTLLDLNIQRFPMYVAKLAPVEEQSLRGDFTGFPVGFYSRVKAAGSEFLLPDIQREADPFLKLQMPREGSYAAASWQAFVVQNDLAVKVAMGEVLAKRAAGRSDWNLLAVDILQSVNGESVEYENPRLHALGWAYAQLSTRDDRYRQLAISTWQEYLRRNPVDSEDTRAVRSAMLTLQRPSQK